MLDPRVPPLSPSQVADRIYGVLVGQMIGDATGMPSELWSSTQIRSHFGRITSFLPGPESNPAAAGIGAGCFTDDTCQAFALLGAAGVRGTSWRLRQATGRARTRVSWPSATSGPHSTPAASNDCDAPIYEDGVAFASALGHPPGRPALVTADDVAAELLAWVEVEDVLRANVLGPSSAAALGALAAGTPVHLLANQGTTNGAVMRISPLAALLDSSDIGCLLATVWEACSPTHKSASAVAGASLIARLISLGVAGWELGPALLEATDLAAAVQAGLAGQADISAWVSSRTLRAVEDMMDPSMSAEQVETHAFRVLGASMETSETVATAVAIAAWACMAERPSTSRLWDCALVCANMGGDTDTIGAIACAIVGAFTGALAVSPALVEQVSIANDVSPEALVAEMLTVRSRLAGTAGALGGAVRPVIVVGAAVGDVIVEVPRLPRPGEDIAASPVETQVGGCGLNVLRTLRRLEIPAQALIPVGCGEWAARVEATLTGMGCEVLLRDPEHDAGWCMAMVTPDGERTFVSVSGAEEYWSTCALAAIDVPAGAIIYVSGYELGSREGSNLLSWLESLPSSVTIAADPGPRILDLPPAVIERIVAVSGVISLNRPEAEALIGSASPEAAARWATSHGVSVVLHADSAGAWAIEPGAAPVHLPTFPVEVVDTIGAGDAHMGGVIAGLSGAVDHLASDRIDPAWLGSALPWAVLVGNAVAANVVAAPGAACVPTLPQLNATLNH